MKSRLLAITVLLCPSGATLLGQDLAGTWQGTLSTPAAQVRIVLRITRATDGRLEGQLFSIDQGAQPRTISLLSVDGRIVKWKADALSATYEGTFTPDGNAIIGSVTQTAAPQPLNFVRATPETAWAIPEPAPPPRPMDPAADPGIEVATVKPSPPDVRGRGIGFRGATMTVTNYTLLNAITFAYDVHEQQVSGGPAWKSTDRFEIVIKPDTPGQPNARQLRRLMQKVLTDRFQLAFHTEKRELSVYAITQPANTTHKMTPATPGPNLPTLRYPRAGLLPARNATVTELAQSLQTAVMNRPVINQTTIEGRFDFTLDWMPDETQFASFGPGSPVADTGKPNIYEAFREQLGLRLESTRAPADIIAIDKVEKPSEN
jgi:bla regulator protein blaR1